MPTRPPRVCNKCKRVAPSGERCVCTPAWQGSSYGNSGTDRRQREMRDAQLAEHPICQWPGCNRLATQGDHIIPVGQGGARYDRTNYQSLCEPHHDKKTRRERRHR